jgi:nucleoside-diphosphate-sugar epimerase
MARLHVVVTGAGGFVGRFLARWLAEQGCHVTAITRQGLPAGAANLVWRKADLAAPDSLPPHFDALVHCAAEIPARCPDPELLYARNVEPTQCVFDQAVAAGARSIVFVSSMSAFGNITVPVITEAVPSDHPDPYGRAKLDCEALLARIVEEGLFSGLSIRLPGTVGKGSHHNFLSDAATRVVEGNAVVAKNPDSLFNNIVHVADFARFIRQWVDTPRAGHVVTMLASQDPLPLERVIALMFECAGKPPNAEFETGGKAPFLISLDRARSLGYQPATVEASVRAMMRDRLSGE